MARKKSNKDKKPKVNKELDGFDIEINSFGEIKSSFDMDKINSFLNKNVDDKKLRDRDDLDEIRGESSDEEGEDEDNK